MAVDQCICHEITFIEIKKLAEEKGFKSVEEVQDAGISSTNCKLCEPYLRTMFKTGQTSFIPGFHLK